MEFEHVLVVGAGQMGGGIAQVVAASGRRGLAVRRRAGRNRTRARRRSRKSLTRLAEKGGGDPGRGARPHRSRSTSIVSADLMIEAVVENAAVKERHLPAC